jgi:hypothetical protein
VSKTKVLIPILISINILISACVYIVLPEGLDLSKGETSKGWSAVVTGVNQTDTGDLHIDLTIRNDTGDWSMMKAIEGAPAVLTTGGKKHNCETVFVGTGGHRLAPGFQMRGYMAGTKNNPEMQFIYVECKGIQAEAGSTLTFNYLAYTGEMDYYQQEEGEASGTIMVELDQVTTDLTYPVFENIEGLIQTTDVSITGLSDNVLSLVDVQRSGQGFEFKWQNYNPTEFALKLHIGNPPVIGSDGIIYNRYEIMDLASTPLTPAGGKVEWTTNAAVPPEVTGFYILLSVESKNMRHYVNYAIDITDK